MLKRAIHRPQVALKLPRAVLKFSEQSTYSLFSLAEHSRDLFQHLLVSLLEGHRGASPPPLRAWRV